jgi:hypothetical protein
VIKVLCGITVTLTAYPRPKPKLWIRKRIDIVQNPNWYKVQQEYKSTLKEHLIFGYNLAFKSNFESLFVQDHLDYPQVQETLFITGTANLIAIDNKCNFPVKTQTYLAHCVQ